MGFAEAPWKTLTGDESLESLCCIKQAKQMAINHLKLFMLASYESLPPFSEILLVFRGISCQLRGVQKEGQP